MFQPTSTKTVESDVECDDETPKKKQTEKKKKETMEMQVMSDISKCMSSVAGIVTKSAGPSSAETDPHLLWAQLLCKKLNKIDDLVAEEFKVDTDKRILALMKSDPKPKEDF